MKKILFLLIPFICFSQTKHESFNFYALDKEVYWQKVFTPSTTTDEFYTIVEKEIKHNINFSDITFDNETISFYHARTSIDRKKYKESSNLPIFAYYDISFFIIINFKDDKCRITIKNIKLYDHLNIQESLDFFFVNNKSQFRTSSTAKNTMAIYENYFNDFFIFKLPKKTDDW